MDALGVADRLAGRAIERLTNAHRARRLGKLGRSAQRTPPDDGRLWAAHLERDIDEIAGDPSTVIDDLWLPIATEQREHRNRGEPMTRGLVQLQATSRRSARLLGPLQALLG